MKKEHSDSLSESDATADKSAARSVARRTLVQGAAWSVPVVAVAVATPAAAASTEDPPADLDITNYTTGPQDGNGSQWPSENGEPGYYQNKPLRYGLRITNHGPGAASQFQISVQTHNVSYKNGTMHVVGTNAEYWEIVSGRPTDNNTNTFVLRWNGPGKLQPGNSVPLELNFSTGATPPSTPVHVVPRASIISVHEGDHNGSNNFQEGTPSYWVKHT